MKVLSIIMELLEPDIVVELHIQLLLLAAMIGFAAILNLCRPWSKANMFAFWHTPYKPTHINKKRPRRPDSCDKCEERAHSLFDDKSSCRREEGRQRKGLQLPRPGMIMNEIMEVGPLVFTHNGKQHEALKWGKPPPKLSSFFQNSSKIDVGPHVVGETVAKEAAEHNLQAFDEFCRLVDSDGLTIVEIARITKHSALEFYNILVQSCIKMNQNRKVAEILTHMAKHKIHRNVSFCEGVLKQLAAARWFKEALHAYPILMSDGPEPSSVICSCMICFAAECGENELAMHFYSRLGSLATPNLRTCMTMLQVHSKQGDWRAALAIYRDMQTRKVSVDSTALNMVMGICAAAGMATEVEQLLAEAQADVSELIVTDVVSYNIVLKAYMLQGDCPNAIKVLMRMRTRGLEPTAITYNSLVDAAARAGEAVAAWKFYQEMVECGFPGDKYTCSILIKTLSPNPTGDHIRKCLDLLREVGTTCELKLRTRLYHSVIEAALQLGDSTILIRSFSQSRLHRVRPAAVSCRQLRDLANQCKEARGKALEAALGDEGVALGSAVDGKQPGGHEALPAACDCDQAKAGNVSIEPQAQIKTQKMQWRPRGSTCGESNYEEVLEGSVASDKPRPSPATQWCPRKV